MTEESKLQGLRINETAPGSSCSSDGASSDAGLLKAVDWSGPDDLEKPVNWPRSKKNQILGAVCLIRFTTYGGFLHHYMCL